MKTFAHLMLALIIGCTCTWTAKADSTLEKAARSTRKFVQERHEEHKELLKSPRLITVPQGPECYDYPLIYFPEGSQRTKRAYYITRHYQAWSPGYGYRHSRHYSDFTFRLPHFIVLLDGRPYCEVERSFDCQFILGDSYYSSGAFRRDYIVERSHQIWDQAAGASEPEWTILPGAVRRDVRPNLLFGPVDALTTASKRAVCHKHNNSEKCVVTFGPLTGGMLREVGTVTGPDGQEHTAYCPEGNRCE
ncbi:MAG: hypothetical protein U0517_00875 [Candidatus Andersenbacteria bacterium]